jgi:hypothetical protein
MKKLFECFPQGSPMHIVLHAQYRRSRGRRPVAVSATEHNPREALRAAYDELGRGTNFINVVRPTEAQTLLAAMKQAGVRPFSMKEMVALIQSRQDVSSPSSRIPNITWSAGRWNIDDKQPLDESWDTGSRFCFAR